MQNENPNNLTPLSEFINLPRPGKISTGSHIFHAWDSIWSEEMKDLATIIHNTKILQNPIRPYSKKAEDEFMSHERLVITRPVQFWDKYTLELRYKLTVLHLSNSNKTDIKLPYEKAMNAYQQALESGNKELITSTDQILISSATQPLL